MEIKNELPNNSYGKKDSSADERRHAKPVAEGKIVRKNKLAGLFNSEADPTGGILSEVVGPAIRQLISDVVINGIQMVLYPGQAPRSGIRTISGNRAPSVSYNNCYNGRQTVAQQNYSQPMGTSFGDILVDSYADVQAVIAEVNSLIAEYGFARVADAYEAAQQAGPFTANSYGWNDITGTTWSHVRGGYIIKFPKASPINML